jgi:hypothetical protein
VDWLKLSVDLPDHPKVAELSDRAFRALIASWCYAARFETDGYLPEQAQRAVGMNNKLAGELEAAGLLHRNGAGWHVHDWDEHQPTAEEIARRRDMANKRQAKYRRRLRGEEGHD